MSKVTSFYVDLTSDLVSGLGPQVYLVSGNCLPDHLGYDSEVIGPSGTSSTQN